MSHLSFDRLRELLQADAADRAKREEESAAHRCKNEPLGRSIRELWYSNGVIFPSTSEEVDSEVNVSSSVQEAPISNPHMPASLYQCPVSEPQTTLTTWNSLPRPVQLQLRHLDSRLEPGSDDVVEVPLAYLEKDSGQEPASTSSDPLVRATSILRDNRKRRLGGNLTNKLSE